MTTTASLADDLRAMAARLDAHPEPLVIGGDGGMLGAIRVLGQIAPHLGGVYAVNIVDGGVRLQGHAEDVAHVAQALGLFHDDAQNRTGGKYAWEVWTGTFDAVTVDLVMVRRVEQAA